MRLTIGLRRKLTGSVLSSFLEFALVPGSEAHSRLSSFIPKVLMCYCSRLWCGNNILVSISVCLQEVYVHVMEITLTLDDLNEKFSETNWFSYWNICLIMVLGWWSWYGSRHSFISYTSPFEAPTCRAGDLLLLHCSSFSDRSEKVQRGYCCCLFWFYLMSYFSAVVLISWIAFNHLLRLKLVLQQALLASRTSTEGPLMSLRQDCTFTTLWVMSLPEIWLKFVG